jgi:hypothetical protein
MTIPSDLFTPSSMFTLAGATVITTVITNSCQHAFNWNPKWLGLIVAIIVTVAGAFFTSDAKPVNYFMGLINGFLVYASSTGIMQMVGTPSSPDVTTRAALTKIRRSFMNQWY